MIACYIFFYKLVYHNWLFLSSIIIVTVKLYCPWPSGKTVFSNMSLSEAEEERDRQGGGRRRKWKRISLWWADENLLFLTPWYTVGNVLYCWSVYMLSLKVMLTHWAISVQLKMHHKILGAALTSPAVRKVEQPESSTLGFRKDGHNWGSISSPYSQKFVQIYHNNH